MNVGDISGVSGYGGYQGTGNIEGTVNRLCQLMQEMVDADAEIHQNFSKQLEQADKELKDLEKSLAKKAPETKRKVDSALKKLNEKMDALKLDNKKIPAGAIILQRQLEELQRKAALAASQADSGGGSADLGSSDTSLI